MSLEIHANSVERRRRLQIKWCPKYTVFSAKRNQCGQPEARRLKQDEKKKTDMKAS